MRGLAPDANTRASARPEAVPQLLAACLWPPLRQPVEEEFEAAVAVGGQEMRRVDLLLRLVDSGVALQHLRKRHPARTARLRRRADGGGDMARHRLGDLQETGHLALVQRQRVLDDRAIEAPLRQRPGEERPLDEGQVPALGVLLALRQHQFAVRQFANDRPHLQAETGSRADAAVTVCRLVAPRSIGVRTDQDRHLLAVVAHALDERGECPVSLFVPAEPVGNERGVDQCRIERDETAGAVELAFQRASLVELAGQPGKREAHRLDRAGGRTGRCPAALVRRGRCRPGMSFLRRRVHVEECFQGVAPSAAHSVPPSLASAGPRPA